MSSSSDKDQTTRRQISYEERDLLVDRSLAKANEALSLGDDDVKPTIEEWVAAMEHVNRAVALTKEPQPRLKTVTAKGDDLLPGEKDAGGKA